MAREAAGRVAVVRRVLHTAGLRRIEFGFAMFSIGEQATWLAVTVFAYTRGGAREAGIVALVQLLPAMLLAPATALVADRMAPCRALVAGLALQSVAMAVTAALMAAGRPIPAYAAATTVAIAVTMTRPVMGSLLPLIARSPADLVAANVVTSMIEQVGQLLGPLLAGVTLALGSPAWVFAITAGFTGLGAVVASGAGNEVGQRTTSRDRPIARAGLVDMLRAVRREPSLAWLVGLLGVSALCIGMVDVLGVMFVESRLGLDGSAAGAIGAAFGFGALSGAAAASALVGGARSTPYLLTGAGVVGVAFVSIAGASALVPGLAAFVLLGAGQALVTVIGNVVVQRHAPTHALGRIFGIIESVNMLAMAIGAVALTSLAAATSLGTALVTAGIAVTLTVVGVVLRLRRAGALRGAPAPVVFHRVAGDRLFSPLALPQLERLAATATTTTYAAGEVVIHEGEPGDSYLMIVEGTVDVSIEGRHVRVMSAGESFGEVALLRSVARTATVRATSPLEVLAVERAEFLQAVTGHPDSRTLAEETTERYLSG